MSDEWRTIPAGSVARIEIGGTPARDQPTFWSDQESGNAWASIADLNSKVVVETAEYISDLGVRSSNVKLVPAGTPIMSFKLTIGRTALAGRDLYTNEAIAAFFPDPTQLESRYLFHILPRSARSVITDVAIKGATLNKKSLTSMQLLLPPPEEQRRIANVIDAIDEGIESAQRVISKLIGLRHGLLRTVILALPDTMPDARRGILDDFVDWLSGGTPAKSSPQFWNGTISWITPKDMKSPLLRRTVDSLTSRGIAAAGSRLAPPDAVFIVVRGMILAHTFPVSRISGSAAFNQDVKALLPRSGLAPDYLMYWLMANSEAILCLVGESTHGTKKLDLSDLKTFPAVIPPLASQHKALAVLRAMDSRIDSELASVRKARSQKEGLLADLLIGRVHVPQREAS
ncbi:MAG: restriction endonuclease subunit S [Actinomycetales bacterium]|nr:restriction endonuclease subunit S [Actinomycetales bacterium]